MEHDERTQPNLEQDQSHLREDEMPREWIEPTFVRMTLKDAMTGAGPDITLFDNPYLYS